MRLVPTRADDGRMAGILGTGSHVPERVVSNTDLVALVPDADPSWVRRRTAISSRRFAAAHEATSDLAAHAARAALTQAGLDADRVDYLIVATSTGDHPQPPTSALVQDLIGAYGAACFDMNAVCAGFVHAVAVAQGLVDQRPGTHALVVAADVYSRILDFTDRRTAVLFGDGAGAVVLGPGDGVLAFDLATRGDKHDLIGVPGGGSRAPGGDPYFRMKGREVTELVLHAVPPFVDDLLSRVGLSADDVDHVVPHQPNGVLLDELVAKCGLAGARTHRTVEEYANVGSASIPLTLDVANRAGALRRGDVLLLLGFGGGMTLGACLLRWRMGE